MPKFLATPLAMTREFFSSNAGYGPVGSPQDYEERQTIEVEAPSVQHVLNEVWRTFQNVDDNWLCPDNGRSLMVGDVIRVANEYGENVTLHKVDSVGFEEVRSLKTIFPRATEAMQNSNITYEDIVADSTRDPE